MEKVLSFNADEMQLKLPDMDEEEVTDHILYTCSKEDWYIALADFFIEGPRVYWVV